MSSAATDIIRDETTSKPAFPVCKSNCELLDK